MQTMAASTGAAQQLCGAVRSSRPRAAAAACRPCAAAAAAAQQQRALWQPAAAGSSSSQRGRGRLLVTAAVKVTKGKQVLCNKTLKAKEGEEEAVQQLCQQAVEFAKQRMADRRNGILAYELSEDDYEKGTFHFLELYSAHRCMIDHNNSDEVKQFAQKLQPLLERPVGMVLYEYSADGKIGPASMEGDVKGEGGLDDATGTNKFGGGASMKQTSAVVDLTQIKEKDDEEKGLWGLKGFKLPPLPDWMKKKAEGQ